MCKFPEYVLDQGGIILYSTGHNFLYSKYQVPFTTRSFIGSNSVTGASRQVHLLTRLCGIEFILWQLVTSVFTHLFSSVRDKKRSALVLEDIQEVQLS